MINKTLKKKKKTFNKNNNVFFNLWFSYILSFWLTLFCYVLIHVFSCKTSLISIFFYSIISPYLLVLIIIGHIKVKIIIYNK